MSQTYVTGFPRIGEKRELKFALEAYWAGNSDFETVKSVAKTLRERHWNYQKERHIDFISCNDFSLYDTMLDTAVMLGAIPPRFQGIEDKTERYFAMARGDAQRSAMEMTKWFNTNYHYIVPEIHAHMAFKVDISKIVDEYIEAKALGIDPKINLIGPLTFLALCNPVDGSDLFGFFDDVVEAYAKVLHAISSLGENIVIQFDEPLFAKTLEAKFLSLLKIAYERLGTVSRHLKIAVVTYFDRANEAVEILGNCPIWAIGLDFVYGEENLEALLHVNDKMLIAGLIDGRNVWKNNASKTYVLIEKISKTIDADHIILSTSCSLLHVPFSTRFEEKLAPEVKSRLSFALEKLEELEQINTLWEKREKPEISACTQKAPSVKSSGIFYTRSAYATRFALQQKALNLPLFPTTTIGSFPQTKETRAVRNAYKKGEITREQYEASLKESIKECVAIQEELGLDVLVHGEFERNDMVEYFGELLEGFAFSQNGWVQSYGSRCVKPPLLYGNVSRKQPLSVDWTVYAQSLTDKPMKGMLTGPVTILNWSFVRDDIPKSEVAYEVATAIAEEVDELQRHDIKIIQVDEAAFKEGYPLRAEKIKAYEKWAVESFKASVGTAWDQTQIHTHMCYSNFNDIIDTIERMDADVITIETSRSGNKLLKVFQKANYKAQIGPGVYDIHSPRVPSVEEMSEQIKAFLQVLPKEQLWINPDCGLKTRGWSETKAALANMIKAVYLAR
ncbi:5-methyltetrahydropteroyltriglutamate--homocysteine S-methyltransferase [Sulfurospirillum multivorans]|uniref:5-methyltetrahydropteroyltriglutamate--homocysteine S-methyltransferase n=2 Tax=Sulfurospirillum multivorans TaxID=66821 RepID=A0AA86AMS5_SULMK|nr:5-methyltetrahydropteroyltriglutamate--homocysteine S-methyltransferase [Sulfurospirillum multivorans]AHJ12311.1 5-methyltetrahydropteroyltriglutamate-- homocysteine methyltransferase [Sulfurospirillum multivorans DSM 12446]QEH05811.1 5-methyltetrahydropteroyltriglutamate-- homocysteine methyltransferase [Sulfurospirillum multivorans]